MNYHIRHILQQDNAALAFAIRHNIELLNLPTQGTAHSDPTTDDLYNLFRQPLSVYFVVQSDVGDVLGGCGIYPTQGLPNGCCELVRFFLLPQWHGKGIGKVLLQRCMDAAKKMGYKRIYLESFPDMQAAVHLYVKYGFTRLDSPLGNTGHYACNVWMQCYLD
jgi:putative acetyltransferase